MNQRRTQSNQSHTIHIVMVIVIGMLLATGGVLHAVMKNRQVEVAREIDAAKSQIEEAEETMKMVQVKIDRKLNRHMIRAELASRGSELKQIPSQAVEVVTTASTSVAQTTP
ncbi:hypothetical protein [Rubritalea tangerina]|uniref:Cell division protein FtsL n=1 Tax=Rubritalea tangerina TaxID=430798 RepID=A0ABW4ZC60_9BACT